MIKRHIKQTFANIERGVREPRSIGSMMRKGLIDLWRARGGGAYGFGYMVTFVVLEVRGGIAQFAETLTEGTTLLAMVIEVVARFGLETLLNMIFALIWPVWLIQYFGGYGVALVAVWFLLFEKLLRPLIESWVPELRAEEVAEQTQDATSGAVPKAAAPETKAAAPETEAAAPEKEPGSAPGSQEI